MDVEQRSGQLYNSELPSSYVVLPVNNNSNMNQFVNQKSKLRKQLKSRMSPSGDLLNLTPTFDVLPKIEGNKYSSSDHQYILDSASMIQFSSNNYSMGADGDKTELPISEALPKNNVDEWLQMPNKMETGISAYLGTGSLVSSNSANMLTPVEMDNFTDCTSVTSSEWGDDVCEFDKNESHKVNQMFEEIEWMLFNDSSSSVRSISNRANRSSSFSERNGVLSGPVHLRRECSEWTHQFPHFRLVGKQIPLPQEQGYSFNESDRSGSVTPRNSPRIVMSPPPASEAAQSRWMSASTDLERLSLVGRSVRMEAADGDPMLGLDELSLGSSQEEVFALDGDMVEIIAIDYKMDEDYNIHNQKKAPSKNALFKAKKGYPPITPNAVIREAVLTAVFDNLWSHVVDWIHPLLTRMQQSCSSRDMVVLEQPEPCQSTASATPDIYRTPKPFSQFPTTYSNLDNLLKISSKTLQFREKSYLQSIPEQAQNLTVSIKAPPNINYAPQKHPLAFMSQIKKPIKIGALPDRSQTPLSLNESSFLHDKEPKRTPPLNQSCFVSAFSSESLSPLRCLRGKALYQSHSPDLFPRSGTLPPIHKYSALTNFRASGSRIGSAQIHNSHHNQSSSTVAHSLATQVLMTSDIANTRPCTSHTARSDQVGGNRSSTPSGTRGSLTLNVHGSSITRNALTLKAAEELPYDQLSKHLRSRPYWKSYNGQVPVPGKRHKSLFNSVK